MIFFVDMTADFRANPPADALHCYSAIADKSIVFVVLPFEQNSPQAEPEIFITFKVPLNPKAQQGMQALKTKLVQPIVRKHQNFIKTSLPSAD